MVANLLIIIITFYFIAHYLVFGTFPFIKVIFVLINFYLIKRFFSRDAKSSFNRIIKSKYFQILFIIININICYKFYNFYALDVPGIRIDSLTFNEKNNTYTILATLGVLGKIENVEWIVTPPNFQGTNCMDLFLKNLYIDRIETTPVDGKFDSSVENIKIIANASKINLSEPYWMCLKIEDSTGINLFLTSLIHYT